MPWQLVSCLILTTNMHTTKEHKIQQYKYTKYVTGCSEFPGVDAEHSSKGLARNVANICIKLFISNIFETAMNQVNIMSYEEQWSNTHAWMPWGKKVHAVPT